MFAVLRLVEVTKHARAPISSDALDTRETEVSGVGVIRHNMRQGQIKDSHIFGAEHLCHHHELFERDAF